MRLDDSIFGPMMESDVEFLPLISEEEEKEASQDDELLDIPTFLRRQAN